MKSDDDNMKKVLKEAKDNGKVKVSINNKEQEYGAKVNGDFLFLYDTNADWNDVVTAFPNYTYAGTGTTGTNGTNGVSEPSNPGTTKNANEQNSNVNTPNDAKKRNGRLNSLHRKADAPHCESAFFIQPSYESFKYRVGKLTCSNSMHFFI